MSTITVLRFPMTFPGEGEKLLLVATRYNYSNSQTDIVGSVQLKPVANDGVSPLKTIQFASLFIDPKARRLGIGKKLMEIAELESRKIHATSMSCYVRPSNIGAQDFYKALGYKPALIFDDGDYCFSKELSP